MIKLLLIIAVLWVNSTAHTMQSTHKSKISPTGRTIVELLPPPKERLALPYTQSLAQLYYALTAWTNDPYTIDNYTPKVTLTEADLKEQDALKRILVKIDAEKTVKGKWDALRPAIEPVLSSYFKRGKSLNVFDTAIPDAAIFKLISILEAEIKYHGYYVTYHGGGSHHGYLVDLFSELLSQAHDMEITACRADLCPFEQNIEEFYNRIFDKSSKTYTNYGEGNDHARGAIRLKEPNGISLKQFEENSQNYDGQPKRRLKQYNEWRRVNKLLRDAGDDELPLPDSLKEYLDKHPYLLWVESLAGFGAYGASFSSSLFDGRHVESALSFFIGDCKDNLSSSNFLIDDILLKKRLHMGPEAIEKFKQMERLALKITKNKGRVMIQYIIHPGIIDQVAWLSGAGGKKMIFSVQKSKEFIGKPIPNFSELWNIIQDNPLALNDILLTEAGSWSTAKDDKWHKASFLSTQARLYFGNGLLADPRYSKILKYWEYEIPKNDELQYQELIRKMASFLLQYYNEHPPENDKTLINKNIENPDG